MSRDEWAARLGRQALRYRVAMALAGHEQAELGVAVKACEAEGALTSAEIQSVLIARGGDG